MQIRAAPFLRGLQMAARRGLRAACAQQPPRSRRPCPARAYMPRRVSATFVLRARAARGESNEPLAQRPLFPAAARGGELSRAREMYRARSFRAAASARLRLERYGRRAVWNLCKRRRWVHF